MRTNFNECQKQMWETSKRIEEDIYINFKSNLNSKL